MNTLTACEWEIVIAAYAYEHLDKPIMSDFSFDTLCKKLRTANIPNFSADTGLWINELEIDLVKPVYEKCTSYHPKYPDVHHNQILQALKDLNIPFKCCNNDICIEKS